MRFQWLILAAFAAAGTLAEAQDEAAGGSAQTDKSRAVEDRLPAGGPAGEKGEPRVSDLRVAVEGQQVRLSFGLVDAFGDHLKKRIDSGLYSGFLFDFELVRARKSWFDKSLESGRLQVVAMYNAVTREYLINLRQNGDLIDSRVVQDVGELEDALTRFDNLNVFSVEGLNQQLRLQVRVRAELGTRTIFFFIPKTIHTDWAESGTFRLADLE
ncbi:MAG: DUF4390 domain-containing protein [Thermoanaerobaculia bacterium]